MTKTFDFFSWFDKTVAACAPAVAETFKAAGYHPAHTGGGCMTWEKVEGSMYVWICTEDNSLDGDPDKPEWLVGLYGPDGEFLNSHKAYTVKDALELAAKLPRDMMTWNDAVKANPDLYQG